MINLSESPKVQLNIRKMLEFYDARVPNEPGFVTSLSAFLGEDFAVGIMAHYFLSIGMTVSYQVKCTQNHRAGKRLDGWLYVQQASRRVLYQTEIKSWAASTYGENRPLLVDVNEYSLSEYRRDHWRSIWPQRFQNDPGLNKVLTRMHPPEGTVGASHKALLCFWWAINPYGRADFFYKKNVGNIVSSQFKSLWVFSLSSYLRSVTAEEIDIPFPRGAKKISLLHSLLPNSVDQ